MLNVTKKSANNNVQFVRVNEQIVPEIGGEYVIDVSTVEDSTYVLEIIAEEESSRINFNNEGYGETNSVVRSYILEPGETIEKTFVVKAQIGTETEEKVVRIHRKDNNLNLESVKVNGTEMAYDEEHKNYSIILENTETQAKLEVKAESKYARLQGIIEKNEYDVLQELTVEDIKLTGAGRKVIELTIVSEEGILETRTITISQFTPEVELEKIEVNGIEATKRADGDYEVIIGDETGYANVYAKALVEASKLDINNSGYYTRSEDSRNVRISGEKMVVPVKVVSEEGADYEYKVYITVKSADTSLEYVKVNEIEAEKLDESTYRVFVEAEDISAQVSMKATRDLATVNANVGENQEVTGNPISFEKILMEESTEVPFKVTAESGRIKEYVLIIMKKSEDNTIGNVFVDDEEVVKDEETGRYKVKVKETATSALVKVVANNEFAKVRINVFDEEVSQSERKVILDNFKVTTVQITIISQTGKTNVEYLDIEKISTSVKVSAITVDNIDVTNYNDAEKTYSIVVDKYMNPHEVIIYAESRYATVVINKGTEEEKSSLSSINFETETQEEDVAKEIKFTVIPEEGEEQEYTLLLIARSDNVNLKQVLVNNMEVLPDEEQYGIYRKNISLDAETADISVTTEYPYANVRIGDCEAEEGTSVQTVSLSLAEEVITVPVVVTATDGVSIETYNIVLTRVTMDSSITASYNGMELYEDESGNYNLIIKDTETEGLIRVEANGENVELDINNTDEYEFDRKEYELIIDKTQADRVLVIPIDVRTEDGEVRQTSLIITRTSTNTNTAKVEGEYYIDEVIEEEVVPTLVKKKATKDEDGVYVIYVGEDTEEITVEITAENVYATIEGNGESNQGVLRTLLQLTEQETTMEYSISAEGVNTQYGIVKIVKQSSNAEVEKIVVNDKEIEPGEDGVYRVKVQGGTESAKVEVTTVIENAKIAIDNTEGKGKLVKEVDVTETENTYIIKVTAEDGTVKEYTLIIEKETNIKGKVITENVNGIHKATVTVYKSSSVVEDTENTTNEENSVNTEESSVSTISENTETEAGVDNSTSKKGTNSEDDSGIIDQVETEDDGTYIVSVEGEGTYDIVITKPGYLDYMLTRIEVVGGEITVVDEHKLIAGDVVKTGIIEIDDLVLLNENVGVLITEENREEKGLLDLNEDGVIDNTDRTILKTNYKKISEKVEWVDPKVQMVLTVLNEETTTTITEFIKPMTCDYVITSQYGERKDPFTGEASFHSGIDISGVWHTEILAVAEGEVTYAGVQNSYGNCIEIKHIVNGKEVYSFYAHLSEIRVKEGDTVTQGQVIALEGGAQSDPNHGDSTGHHLHFEIRSASGWKNNVNPNDYIEF